MIDRRPEDLSITAAGDAALLIELPAVIDAEINARAIAIARHVEALAVPGVRDVVPTYRSVAVHFDPLQVNGDDLTNRLAGANADVAPVTQGRLVEVPVVYGGESGPDLGAVAGWAGKSPEEAIRRHTTPVYRVFMLGFLPGFPYLGTVDPAIAAPRRATPRVRVPAGSVGIAGAQTGIYPMTSPGGWQIIGRTDLPLFDSSRTPASTLAPGDLVKFVAIERSEGGSAERGAGSARPAAAHAGEVLVLEPGLFTTIQDGGRWGYQSVGVPVSGAMDWWSFRAANALVGNRADAAVLEATITGPALRFESTAAVAIAGADLGATLDGRELRPGMSSLVNAGAELKFTGRRSGARAYIAFGGGVDVGPVLGSRATHTLSGMGGLEGRALRAGDRLPLGHWSRDRFEARMLPHVNSRAGIAAPIRVRVLPGPQASRFPAGTLDQLTSTTFTVAPQSNRMGYRLAGSPIAAPAGEMISDATFTGAIQVPPSGEPILLMSDRQTTGGYPQLAIVITADLPLAGQLAPGDAIQLSVSTPAAARAALVERERMLTRVA